MRQEVMQSIAKNSRVMMGSQVITWISSFILMMFLPRYLGSADYGRLYLAVSTTLIFQMMIDFGGHYFIPKEVARDREATPRLVVNIIALRIVLWLLSLVMIIALALLFKYSATVTALLIILGASKLWESAGRALSSCFQGWEMMKFPMMGAVVERIFITVTGITALLLGANAIVIAVLMAIGTLLHSSVVIKYAPKIISHVPQVEWKAVLGLVKSGAPYFLWSVFAVIYYRVDAIMLPLWCPEAVVGWYGAAYRFFDVFMFLPSIIATTVLPILSRLWKQEQDTLAWTTQKSLEAVIIAGIPLSIGIFAFAEPFIQFFFGLEGYGPSVQVLQIFAAGMLLVYVDFILGTALIASDKQRSWTVVAFLAMILNPLMNYYMIPYAQTYWGNGGLGAALTTLATEGFVMLAALVLIPKSLITGFRLTSPLRCLVAGFLMIGALEMMGDEGVHWMVQGILGVCVYGVGVMAMRVIEPSDATVIRKMFSVRGLKNVSLRNEGAGV